MVYFRHKESKKLLSRIKNGGIMCGSGSHPPTDTYKHTYTNHPRVANTRIAGTNKNTSHIHAITCIYRENNQTHMTRKQKQKHKKTLFRAFFIAAQRAQQDIERKQRTDEHAEHLAYTFITTRNPITYIPKR